MPTVRPVRHYDKGNPVSRTVLSVVRILIASYFLAMATGLIFEPASRTFLDPVLAWPHAQIVTTTYLFVMAFSIMVGVAVRPAALMLAVYIFWSGFTHYDFGDHQTLGEFWRDMALLGGILLIAVTEPGGSRRISALESQPTTDRAVYDEDQDQGLSTDAWNLCVDAAETDPDAQVDNLFADVWDRPAKRRRAPVPA